MYFNNARDVTALHNYISQAVEPGIAGNPKSDGVPRWIAPLTHNDCPNGQCASDKAFISNKQTTEPIKDKESNYHTEYHITIDGHKIPKWQISGASPTIKKLVIEGTSDNSTLLNFSNPSRAGAAYLNFDDAFGDYVLTVVSEGREPVTFNYTCSKEVECDSRLHP